MYTLVLLSLIFCVLSQPALPLPPIDIPSNLDPPLAHGRVDVHGWLWLPIVANNTPSSLMGWFYHHTPEFETHSPHDFEIMAMGVLTLEKPVQGLPLPPDFDEVGTEYVFTPPEFSLDDVISGQLSTFKGKFTNGSFDTPQRYLLSMAQLDLQDLTTIHYLEQNASAGYPNLVYYSYPRDYFGQDPDPMLHLYFLHLLEQSPDFDQILHVVVDPDSCVFVPGDDIDDVISPSAQFLIPESVNKVEQRLSPSLEAQPVWLLSDPQTPTKTVCQMFVLEEVHCVVMPDSFKNCPPVSR